ncbi:peptidase M24 [Wolbachia pipientis]|uniref:Peptidase M24 n=1 Tax=Wolbachia pipientis TaxID=955 RepID=A0A1E7QK49_WOLPI|nr:M23 family metallopeptidase [Wolbachia pipientis]OEY86594.1 peptidase M24 [Wolbachia pipientis]
MFLTGCFGLQKPAPVLLKGEEFYGKRSLESIREYRLIKENVNNPVIKVHDKDKESDNTAKFIMPINGNVVQSIDKLCKDGIKIAAHAGTNVVASASGKVIYVGRGLRWYGNLVIIEHIDNYMTVYSYLKNICVEIGDHVQQGQIIGSAGKSSTQDKNPQMCFTIRHNGEAVDTLSYIY